MVLYDFVANCPIEVLSYSAHGTDMSCTLQNIEPGFVKVNKFFVWLAAWCVLRDRRGVNIFVVDPFKCSVQETRKYDTHYWSSHSTQLSNYLRQLSRGTIIVGVSADEPSEQLSNAYSALRELGVEVSDVQRRGSFAFIAQKGFPSKTVARKAVTVTQSNSNPAQFNVVITGKVLTCNLSLKYV